MSIILPDTNTVPPVNEHMEAYQAQVNEQRAEKVASLSPEEQARMGVIESVSSQLEKAGIPFVVWASPMTNDKTPVFWRFNRLEYLPDDTPFPTRSDLMMRILFWRLAPTIANWTTAGGAKFISFFGKEKEFLYGYDMSSEPCKIVLPPEEGDEKKEI